MSFNFRFFFLTSRSIPRDGGHQSVQGLQFSRFSFKMMIMDTTTKAIKILVVNSAERGVTEFTEPVTAILADAGTASETVEYAGIPEVEASGFSGVILSGSPRGDDIVDHHQPFFTWVKTCRVPVLGFCAGHHVIGAMYGAQLLRNVEKEVGDFFIHLDRPGDPLFRGMDQRVLVRENHHDSITLPPGWVLLAHSDTCKVQAMRHPEKDIYTTQFHPETLNKEMIVNFINIARGAYRPTQGNEVIGNKT